LLTSDPKQLKIGIIGLGSIGTRHLHNFRELGITDLEVWDANTSKSTFGDLDGIRWNDSLEQLLERGPDAVVICTPTHLHAESAIAAINAGCHVLVEKPIAVDLTDADKIVEASTAMRIKVLVGCNLRYHPGVAMLKKCLDDGLVGRPILARAEYGRYLPHWRPGVDYRNTYSADAAQGGGIILETVHEIDYLMWFGGGVKEITGYSAKLSDLDIDTEDSAGLSMRMANGMLAELHVDYLRPIKRRGCEVIGSEGSISWTTEGAPPEHLLVTHLSNHDLIEKTILEQDAYDHNEQYLKEAKHFLDVVTGTADPILDAAGGRDVLAVALQARMQTFGSLHSQQT
jgi:predicted dehydrogenase